MSTCIPRWSGRVNTRKVRAVVAGLKALWDYGQIGAYVLLIATLTVAVFAAFKLRRYLYELPESVAEKA